MKTDEIRQRYLDFYQTKGHKVCASDVLVPKWDPTVLFTPAGMNPFKDHFLGNVELEFTRATSSQKCLRTGDIENVGRTAYHHTFFEMLGNFSFGDYFKKEAIHWAWEFLTDKKWMGIDPQRLSVTVYLDDDEASDIWHKDVGLPLERIERLGEHDNFWPAGAPTDGPDGVCGPCSEIFFHPDDGPECEIWNLVFTQFNRSGEPPNNLSPLPSKNIDTGMGLERMAATLQGVETNYHIDTLLPIVHAAAEICGVKYEAQSDNGRRMRRITDHVRACTMSIHENVLPGSNNENFVIRKLLRRAFLQGYMIGLKEPFLAQLVPAVVDSLKGAYPEIAQTVGNVQDSITNEENDFLRVIGKNIGRVEKLVETTVQKNQKEVDYTEAADFYQTYGIPAELTEGVAEKAGLDFDHEKFRRALEELTGGTGGGPTGVMGDSGPIDELKKRLKRTTFLGYDTTSETATVEGLVIGEEALEQVTPENGECYVVLSQTPFYAKSGGQESDFGTLKTGDCEFEVTEMEKTGDLFVHVGRVKSGTLKVGDEVSASVNMDRRSGVSRAHSATHILHYALHQHVGEHATQRGSRVDDDKFRFDFANQEPVSKEQLSAIEKLTLEKINEGVPVKWETVSLEDAKTAGAMMLFGEKYPDPVRMVSIGEFSKELCGGTHLNNSSDVMAFEIVSEFGTSAGVRRIEALTGKRALENQEQVKEASTEIARILDVHGSQIGTAVKILFDEVRDLKKQASSGKKRADAKTEELAAANESAEYLDIRGSLFSATSLLNVPTTEIVARVQSLIGEKQSLIEQIEKLAGAAEISIDDLIAEGTQKGDMLVIAKSLPVATPDLMRQLIDQIRKKTNPVAVFFATSPAPDKVLLIAGLSRDLVQRGIKAGDWIKTVAPIVGGGGGGKPDLAQAGGKNPENIEQALSEAVSFIESKL